MLRAAPIKEKTKTLCLFANIATNSVSDALAIIKKQGLLYLVLEYCQCPDSALKTEAFTVFYNLMSELGNDNKQEALSLLGIKCVKRDLCLLEILVSFLDSSPSQPDIQELALHVLECSL